MPTLNNPKHETFAQNVAKGMTLEAAYAAAGFKPNRKAASNLWTKVDIKARVVELLEKTAEKTIESVSWDAKDLFGRMNSLIERAAEAGDFKAAIDGSKFVLRCFGYEDAPTLTNEDVRGRKIHVQATQGRDDEPRQDGAADVTKANITSLTDALKKYQRRA